MTHTFAALGEFGDAINFIFTSRENQRGSPVGGSHNLPLIWEHLKLCGAAMGLALLISLPLGLVLGHTGKGSFLAISVSNVGRAVPSVAVFFLLLPLTGRGKVTALIALVAYSLLIIFRNVITGLDGVPAEARDAGRGMGLTERQLLWKVELPLALPEIMAGLRIAVTTTVGLTALVFLAGAGGLGEAIFADTQFQSNVVVAGGLCVLLAVVLDLLVLGVQKALTPWTRAAAR
jgi:osmoprotectant transport system permease protein